MRVKGIIIEDAQGREFVTVCQLATPQLGRTFAIRGWQRRRLVPFHHTKQERRVIIGGVLLTLYDLIASLTRYVDDAEGDLSDGEITVNQ